MRKKVLVIMACLAVTWAGFAQTFEEDVFSGTTFTSSEGINTPSGTANYQPFDNGSMANTPDGPRYIPSDDPIGGVPVGDALLPLLIMLCAFAGVRMVRQAHDEAKTKA